MLRQGPVHPVWSGPEAGRCQSSEARAYPTTSRPPCDSLISVQPCPTNHDRLRLSRVSRRVPARCLDCGTDLEMPDLLALLVFWIEERRRETEGLRMRTAAVEEAVRRMVGVGGDDA